MTPLEFQRQFAVSDSVIERLRRYEALLRDWQQRMNLVGPATLDDIWWRHFADSAQLAALTPAGKHWLDIGAGGGFPGMVLAAMGHGRFTLVDSVQKKTRFLEAVRADVLEDANPVRVIAGRVEALPTLGVDVVTARATAALATLFDWAIRHVRPGGICVFPKGRRWAEEVAEAETRFLFDYQPITSITDIEARILVARNLKRR